MKNLKTGCLISTNSNRRTKSIYDEYKKNFSGVVIITDPFSGKELRLPFENENERKIWIELKKETMKLKNAA